MILGQKQFLEVGEEVVPFPKIVINLPGTYEKVQRLARSFGTNKHTDKQTCCYFSTKDNLNFSIIKVSSSVCQSVQLLKLSYRFKTLHDDSSNSQVRFRMNSISIIVARKSLCSFKISGFFLKIFIFDNNWLQSAFMKVVILVLSEAFTHLWFIRPYF